MIDRLPNLRQLSLQGCSAAVLSALKLPAVSPAALIRPALLQLTVLDLSWVSGINDVLLDRTIFSSTPHRLSNLKKLALAGNDLSDKSLPAIPTSFPHLEGLCLAHCRRLSTCGLYSMLTAQKDHPLGVLKQLHVAGCTQTLHEYAALQQQIRSLRPHLHLVDNTSSDPQLVHRCFPFN